MDNFLLLVVCFLLGIGLRKSGLVGEKGPSVLNVIIIYMSVPALAMLYTHDLPLEPGLLLPAGMAWIVLGAGYLFFKFVGGWFGLDDKTVACLVLTCGLGNTSFVGLPMIEALFGPEYLGVGMICDTAGTFLGLAIPGIILAAKVSGQGVSGRDLLRKIVFFPPFLAILLGLALQPVPYPIWLTGLLTRLGATLSPLALLSVGLTLRFSAIRGNGRELAFGVGYKLVLAPMLVFALYIWGVGATDMVTRVAVFESAMGPMVTGGIIAMAYGLRPSLAATILGVGIPLSFLTLPIWYKLLMAV